MKQTQLLEPISATWEICDRTASKASPPLPDFVEASTNCETSFGPVQTATNIFPPITVDCTSSPGPSPRSASSGPRDPVAPLKAEQVVLVGARTDKTDGTATPSSAKVKESVLGKVTLPI
jgi:hypothetical protein